MIKCTWHSRQFGTAIMYGFNISQFKPSTAWDRYLECTVSLASTLTMQWWGVGVGRVFGLTGREAEATQASTTTNCSLPVSWFQPRVVVVCGGGPVARSRQHFSASFNNKEPSIPLFLLCMVFTLQSLNCMIKHAADQQNSFAVRKIR
jgi:hypothetical protein